MASPDTALFMASALKASHTSSNHPFSGIANEAPASRKWYLYSCAYENRAKRDKIPANTIRFIFICVFCNSD